MRERRYPVQVKSNIPKGGIELDFFHTMTVRATSDADITAIYMRADQRVDKRLEGKTGLADLYSLADRAFTLEVDNKLVAVATIESNTETNVIWSREDFQPETISTVFDGWMQLVGTAMTRQTTS